jgi:hypothetical protein
MSIERKHFETQFNVLPPWRCSTCNKGLLVEEKDKRINVEPAFSGNLHSEDWWEPEHMTQRFASLLKCQNPSCGEFVFVTGNTVVDMYYDEDGPNYYDVFEPLSATPSIAVFALDERWPESVRNQLKLAFSHVFSDPGASANRLRTAVECLMDDRGIRKYPRTGRRRAIDLHTRISDFKSQSPDAADLLLAVKWLGNAGSHADVSGLNRKDVLDGMELLERALHLIYDDTAKRLAKLARDINRRRGPRKRS